MLTYTDLYKNIIYTASGIFASTCSLNLPFKLRLLVIKQSKPNSSNQSVRILSGPNVMSCHFSGEFQPVDDRVIYRISIEVVNICKMQGTVCGEEDLTSCSGGYV